MNPPMTDDLVGRLRKLLADAEQQRREALNHLPGDTKFMMLTNAAHAERHVLAQVPLLFARIEALEAENRKLREAVAPFLDLGPQTGAWGVISKKLTGMAPLTLTVTKDQFKALWALAKDHTHAD